MSYRNSFELKLKLIRKDLERNMAGACVWTCCT